MPSKITLLRHAMPEVDASASPDTWPLSTDGVAAASGLVLAAGTVASSPELKALQTTALACGVETESIEQDARFREVDRVERVHDGFREARRAWVAGQLDERHEGWETADAAAQRFHDGLRAHPAEHLIVGTHGMVLTSWLAAQGLVGAGDEAVAFWEALRFPDALQLTLPLLRVRAVLTDADGRFVLIKRARPGQHPYWTAPGGGVQLNDSSAEAALRRELREELGATADVGSVLFERPLDSIRSERFYAAELTTLDPSLRDGPEFSDATRGTCDVDFVTREELASLDLRPIELKALLFRG